MHPAYVSRSLPLPLVVGAIIAAALTAVPDPAESATATPPVGAHAPVFDGRTMVRNGPLAGAKVELRRAGSARRPGRVLATTRSRSDGRFRVRLPYRIRARDVLYVTTRGGRRVTPSGSRRAVPKQLRLSTLIGRSRPGRIVVNERTTVAAGFAAAQFVRWGKLSGKSPGLPNAAKMSHNLADIRTGRVAAMLRRAPNGNRTQTMATFNTLANSVAACAMSSAKCRVLLRSANAGKGSPPRSTFQAMADTARFPAYRARALFRSQHGTRTFAPALATAPKSWALALKFVGNRKQFDGPGNIAIDRRGDVWANNNYEKSTDPKQICGGKEIFKLYPYRRGAPVSSFSGGGLDGAGFGIGLDPKGHVWTSNFGFMGSKCTDPPTSDSVSEFRANGTPVSGRNGYRRDISWPQAIVSNRAGDIWIANCGSDSVVRYPGGNPIRSRVVATGVTNAFGVAIDRSSNAWVTASGENKVYAFDTDGTPLPGSPFSNNDFKVPMGIATDSSGQIWIANQGVAAPPCDASIPGDSLGPPPAGLHGTISRIDGRGRVSTFSGGGLTAPWNLTTDGSGNIWVANFQGSRLSHFCGSQTKDCARGKRSGDALSPRNVGYAFDGLQRNTGIAVDSSGNVWLTNNWKNKPVQINPGGNGLVAFVGLASPIKTPTIGVPQRP